MLPSTSDLLESISHRRSLGLSSLKSDPVDREILEQMIEAANWGQSHGDTEPWRFCIFSGNGREQLAELFGQAYKDNAPADYSEESYQAFRDRAFAAPVWISISMAPELKEDGTLAMTEDEELMAVATAVQNLHLVAGNAGLGGMWHSKGLSIHPTVAKGIGIEAPSRLLGFFFCGWPNKAWPEGERGPVADKVRWFE